MIDILLVNPTENHYKFLDLFKEKGITYNIVVTAGHLASYHIDSKFLYNHNVGPSLSNDVTFKSAIGCNLAGQRLVEKLTQEDRILLSNLKDKATTRLKNWYSGAEQQGKLVFETVSYKGQHVLNCCLSFKEEKWTLFENQSDQDFVNKVEYAFEALDDMGIRNGPTQIFIDTGNGVSIRTFPLDGTPAHRFIKRHFMDIWNVILQREVDTPAKSLVAYQEWAEQFGPTKKFQFA